MSKHHIFVASLYPLDRDPRVLRQLHALRHRYRITAAGFSDPNIDGVAYIPIPRPSEQFSHWPRFLVRIRRKSNVSVGYLRLLLKQYEDYYWSHPHIRVLEKKFLSSGADLIYANDLELLPVASRSASRMNAKVFMDAHEFTPRQDDHRWMFRTFFQPYWDFLCGKYLSGVDGFITVSKGIAEEYTRRFGVDCGLISNAPFYEDLMPTALPSDGSIRMIHHGSATRDRGLENMIHLIDKLDHRFRLEFMLMPDSKGYIKELREKAARNPRITFRTPVRTMEIASTINDYDIGLYLLQPISSNQRLALPNKIFEFIQGRLAVAIWPSPEMKRLVEEWKVGRVAEDFTIDAMADILNSMTIDEIMVMKQTAHIAAKELCAEKNGECLLKMIDGLMACP